MTFEVDYRQDLAQHPEVQSVTLKYGDIRFPLDEESWVIIEEKRVRDLEDSYRKRRLQRQLRNMLWSNPKGVNILGLRASSPMQVALQDTYHELTEECMLDLMKWQMIGGVIGYLPYNVEGVLRTLKNWRAILKPGQHFFSIVAGTDEPPIREDMTPTAYAIRRLFKGVGPTIANKIAAFYKQDLARALGAPDQEWLNLGAHKGILRQKGLLDGEKNVREHNGDVHLVTVQVRSHA
tara:strand:+ start:283 stop:990 length:708 start_codon:yes stop_codon:yes gene_type:complete